MASLGAARWLAVALTLSSFTSGVVAGGYGNYPCTKAVVGGPDQELCKYNTLLAKYGKDTTVLIPFESTCVKQPGTSDYFCGTENAYCKLDSQCDNGRCNKVDRLCEGSFGAVCDKEQTCLGQLKCSDDVEHGVCGGEGSMCAPEHPDLAHGDRYDHLCATGYCNLESSKCDHRIHDGASCAHDPHSCETGSYCNHEGLCAPKHHPSAKPDAAARRRSLNFAGRGRSLCPPSHTMCTLSSLKSGYECVDTSTNLEQCGGCASNGGVDCTSIPGVEGVACVESRCEIWSCATGYTWNAQAEKCEA